MPNHIWQSHRELVLQDLWAGLTITHTPENFHFSDNELRRQAKLAILREKCNELRRDATIENWMIWFWDDVWEDWPWYQVRSSKRQIRAADWVRMIEEKEDRMPEELLDRFMDKFKNCRSTNESDRQAYYGPCQVMEKFNEVKWDQPATRKFSPPVSPMGPARRTLRLTNVNIAPCVARHPVCRDK
jgi:hypothetical protein